MDLDELISRLAVALGIGLLIGLERGWRRRGATPGSRAAGIPTSPLSGLLGGVTAALAQALPKPEAAGAASLAIVLGVAFAAYSAVIALFARDENQAAGNFSATTAIAGMLTFVLGAYALIGDMRIAAGAAVAATALLAAREELHGWVEQITLPELRSAAALAAIDFLCLPIFPRTPLGAFWGGNLREGLAHRHRARQRLLPRLCGGEIFRCAPRVAAGGRGRGRGVLDRGHHRQCAPRRRPRRFAPAAGGRRGDCVGRHVPARDRHR